jgi:uncharacterized SAM-binding protein YcdF (DUF218 family)
MAGKLIRTLAALTAVIILVWSGGLVWFVTALPRDVTDSFSRTDGIVVLTGGSERIDEGLKLLADGRSKTLLLSGVHRGTSRQTLAKLTRQKPALFKCCVELGREAGDTVGNARETAAWAVRHSMESLRLVTSAYHMPRSLVEFRSAMADVRLIAHPVFTESVKLDGWWRWPGTAMLLAGEFNKYFVSLTRARLALGNKSP